MKKPRWRSCACCEIREALCGKVRQARHSKGALTGRVSWRDGQYRRLGTATDLA